MSERSFRFLHTADLHLDSPLRGLESYPGAPVQDLRLATRKAFAGLIEEAIEREVAFVLLVGDLFDGDWQDYNSGLWFNARMRQLEDAGIQVYAVRGNHDAESRVEKKLSPPRNVYFFPSKEAETRVIEELGVALHGQSYPNAAVGDNLARHYPSPRPGLFNVGLLHTALDGRNGHASYAPCTAQDLKAKGYEYWALGHVHRREIVSENPWIVFPGNPQGRHIRETGAKGATLAHVEDGRVTKVEEIHRDVVRWQHVAVDVSECEHIEALSREVERRLKECARSTEGRMLAARVALTGVTALDAELRLDRERVRAEVRNAGQNADSDIWVEKVLLETSHPDGKGGKRLDGSRLVDLAGRIEEATLPDEVLTRMAGEQSRLADKLPSDAREAFDPRSVETLLALLEDARRDLASFLRRAEEADA
jgi:exonuclease SbcD